jgi:hypothetical protein
MYDAPPPAPGYRQTGYQLASSSGKVPPRGQRPWLLPVIAVMVIVMVVIAALFALGLFRASSGNGTSSSTSTPDYSAAQSTSKSIANHQSGGPWKLYSVYGLAPAFPFNVTINATWFTGNSSCTPPHLGIANGSTITISEFSGNPSSGEASFWLFDFLNSSGGWLIAIEDGGDAYALVTVSCSSEVMAYATLLSYPTSLSSASAAAAAWANGGSSFAKTHPGIFEAFILPVPTSVNIHNEQPPWTIS